MLPTDEELPVMPELTTVSMVPLRYLAQPDAAKYLGISPRALWALSAPRGPVPVVRIGGRVVFDVHDLDEYAASCKILPA